MFKLLLNVYVEEGMIGGKGTNLKRCFLELDDTGTDRGISFNGGDAEQSFYYLLNEHDGARFTYKHMYVRISFLILKTSRSRSFVPAP